MPSVPVVLWVVVALVVGALAGAALVMARRRALAGAPDDRGRELDEARAQQAATAEILTMISASPDHYQPVLDAIVKRAVVLCEGLFGAIYRYENELVQVIAHHGVSDETVKQYWSRYFPRALRPPEQPDMLRPTLLGGETVHIRNAAEDPRVPDDSVSKARGIRSVAIVPIRRSGRVVGALSVSHLQAAAFTERRIALLQTFADQAIIAVENVRLFKELETHNAALSEALDQQTATAEILRVLSSSPTDMRPAFDAILEHATVLCQAPRGALFRFDGEVLTPVAVKVDGPVPDFWRVPFRPTPASGIGRAIATREPVHIADILDDPAYRAGDPLRVRTAQQLQARTCLWTPFVKDDHVLGVMTIYRREVRPFSAKQLELLRTFADQAVIAIENGRVFTELAARNADLSEALDRQTATAEILRVISSSPTDLQPVMEAVVRSAARLCEAQNAQIFRVEGPRMRLVARHGQVRSTLETGQARPITRGSVSGRAIVDRVTLHVHDLLDGVEREYPDIAPAIQRQGIRTTVGVPLLREGVPIGCITAYRLEVRPFTPTQVALLETFADQAVIAIENARLFTELQQQHHAISVALEQQTATAEILRVISGSPTDVQPVFDAIAESAVRLCDATRGGVLRYDGEQVHIGSRMAARTRAPKGAWAAMERFFPSKPVGLLAAALTERVIVHAEDVETDPRVKDHTLSRAIGYRAILIVPMLRDDRAIGAIIAVRDEPRGFTDNQIALLQTFAEQAGIAVENVRLFQELQARTADLTRSVGELEALSEVGRTLSATLDLPTVLTTIVTRAVGLSGTSAGMMFEYDESESTFHLRATHNLDQSLIDLQYSEPIRLGEGAVGRTVQTRAPVEVPDLREALHEVRRLQVRRTLVERGFRSVLAVPLLVEDRILGALVVLRREAGGFAPPTVDLLRTFATQSALAIQNARLFREIEGVARELEVANRHKSEFLASVSHELRTPLNAIIGFSEVMLERMFGDVNAKQEEYLHDILDSGRHLLSLINDILDLAKIEAGRMELEAADFHLPQAIDNALVLVRERAVRRGITLERAIDPKLEVIKGDERKVKQVLLNLLANAVRFTPEGGRIDVRAVLAGEHVEISVADSGLGIAPEDHEAIFEEFRQVGSDRARRQDGTGLGLALARRFVELHGGHIRVDSDLGRGATFTFSLPLAPWPAS